MNKLVRNAIIVLLVGILSACASQPKVALKPETKQNIKRIALMSTHEPARYMFHPGALPGGSTLYMFGALGGAILGGIEANRFETATNKFTAAVTPLNPDLSNTLLGELESKLREKGYEITRISELPKGADGKTYNFAQIDGTYDAILIPTLNGGYSVGASAVAPRMSVSVQMTSADGSRQLFADTYSYGADLTGKTEVTSDPKFAVQSVDAVYENIGLAVEGLRFGAVRLADRVVADL